MQNQLTSTTTPSPSTEFKPDAFIGIDYHKHYSVYHVLDAAGKDLAKGRIEHCLPEEFAALLKRWQHPRVVFEATMNWHWLLEVLEQRSFFVRQRTMLRNRIHRLLGVIKLHSWRMRCHRG